MIPHSSYEYWKEREAQALTALEVAKLRLSVAPCLGQLTLFQTERTPDLAVRHGELSAA